MFGYIDRQRARLAVPAGLLLVPLILALAACGPAGAANNGVLTLSSPEASAGASPAASTNPRDALLAFTQCMRDHGVDMPDPEINEGEGGRFEVGISGPKGNVDREELQEAQEACQHLLAAMEQGRGGQLSPEDQDKILAFTQCMRDHGIDLPDPQFGGGGMAIVGGGADSGPKFDPGSEEFQAAEEACESLLPDGLGGPSTKVNGEDPSGGDKP